jgi:hypothetical protein
MAGGGSRGSTGGARAGGGGSRVNAQGSQQIVPANGDGGHDHQNGLLDAVSEIQHYYVMEEGQEIPVEFLTINRCIEFFKTGAMSGFGEGLILFLLYPLFEFYLLPFVFKVPDLTTKILFESIPWFIVGINTLICVYVSRFYVGKITRRAINNLLMGRSMALVLKGALIFILYYMIAEISTPEKVWLIAQNFGGNAESVYYGFFQIKDHLIPAGTKALCFLAGGALGPFGTVYVVDLWRQRKIKSNLARVTSQPIR